MWAFNSYGDLRLQRQSERNARSTRTRAGIVGKHWLGANDHMFDESPLKPRTGIYLKSAGELQVDGQSPFLESGTKKAECHCPQRWAYLNQEEKGPLVR